MKLTLRLFIIVLIPILFSYNAHAQNTIIESKQTAKIASGLNGLGTPLLNNDHFGTSITSIGDLNGDGIEDIAVSAIDDDAGKSNAGSVYILFLNADGSVKKKQKISSGSGNLGVSLDIDDNFGFSLASISDLNKDGTRELAVGTYLDDDGGTDRGAVYILYMDTTGLVKRTKKISNLQGNFKATLGDDDRFGAALANVGDYDGDGYDELAVGAHWDDDGGTDHGAFYILFLDTAAQVRRYQKVSDTQGKFTGTLDQQDYFGFALANIGDLNDDGVNDIAVGAMLDDDGGSGRGAVWILFMDTSGTVNSYSKISSTLPNFNANIENDDRFGRSVAGPGDYNGDGIEDLLVGAMFDDDGSTNAGAVWLLYLDKTGNVNCYEKFSSTEGNLNTNLSGGGRFGVALAALSDFDKNGIGEFAVGASYDPTGGTGKGAYYFISPQEVDLKILSKKNTYCEGTPVEFDSKDGKYVNWYNSNNKLIATDSAFTIEVSKTDTVFYFESGDFAAGCAAYDTLKIKITETPQLTFNTISVCGTQSVQIGPNKIPNKYSFKWSTSLEITDSLIANPYVDVKSDAILYVNLYDSISGCSSIDSQIVIIDNCTNGNCNVKTYQKTYGGSGNDEAVSIIQTRDGNLVTSGNTSSFGSGGDDIFVMKTAPDGSILWYRTYGGSGDDNVNELIEARNGDLLLTGLTKSFGGSDEDLYALRLSSLGALIWSRVLGGTSSDIGQGIVELPNGEIVLHMQTISYSSATAIDMAFVKLNSAGVPTGIQRRFGQTDNEGVGNIINSFNKSLITCGNTAVTNNYLDGSISEISASGNLLWTKTYGGSGATSDDRFFRIIRTSDKNYLAVGRTNSYGAGKNDCYLVKVDQTGKVLFAKTYGGSDNDEAYNVIEDASGNFLLSGITTSFGTGSSDLLLIKVNSTGNIIWSKTYGDSGVEGAKAKSGNLVEVSNGYMLCGFTTVSGNTQAYLIHLDKNGNAAVCKNSNPTISSSSPNITATAATLPNAVFIASTTTGVSSGSISSISDSLYCDSFCVNFSWGISCGNTPLKLTDESAKNPIAWAWSVYDSIIKTVDTSSLQNPEFNLSPGQYYITLSATNGVDTNAITHKVTIFAEPSYTRSSDTTICSGDSVKFEVTGGNKITWYDDNSVVRNTDFSRMIKTSTSKRYGFIVEDTVYVCSVEDTINLTIQSLPVVAAGKDTAVCFGDSIQLTGSAPDSFYWTPANTLSKTDTLTPFAKPNSTTKYALISIDKLGCSATDTIEISVRTLPKASAGNDATICLGDKVTLTATGGGNYTWNTSATTASIQEQPNADTKYWVQVTDAKGCKSDFDTVNVFVPNLPVTVASANDTICFGASTQISASGGFSYVWSTTDTVSSINVSPNASTDYYVQAKSGNGCLGNTDTVSVIVESEILATVSPNDTICVGDSSVLTATGGVKYKWTTGDTTASITVKPSTNTIYGVQAEAANGCLSASISTEVIVTAAVKSFAGVNDTICPGESYLLKASGGDYFEWNDGTKTDTLRVSPTGDTSFWVIASTDYCTAAADTVEISLYNAVNVSVDGPSIICEGDTATFRLLGNGTKFEWYQQLSASDSFKAAPIKDTFYYGRIHSAQGCISPWDTAFLTVSLRPKLIMGPRDTICEGQDATIFVSGANTYLWETGETNDTATVTTNNDKYFTVVGFSAFGCASKPDSVEVISLEAPEAYLGEDQTICFGQILTLNPGIASRFLWSTGETKDSIKVSPIKDTFFWVEPSNVACVGEKDTIRITVKEKTVVTLLEDKTMCSGDTTKLEAVVDDPVAKTSYIWSTGDTSKIVWVKPLIDQTYWVKASIANECESEPDSATVSIRPSPLADFTISKDRGLTELKIAVKNTSENWNEATWIIRNDNFVDTVLNNENALTLSISEIGAFNLTLFVRNKFDCIDSAIYDSIYVFEKLYIDNIANGFTPNGDGVNDSFNFRHFDLTGIEQLNGKIFDRWGVMVHEWENEDWWTGDFRGSPCPTGVYVYIIEIFDKAGGRRQLTGNVTLIR